MAAYDISARLSLDLKNRIQNAVFKLYKFCLMNAKETYNNLMMNVEKEIGLHELFVDVLAKKLAFDLKNYKTYKDADWFITQRLHRVGHDHFATLLTKSHVSEEKEINSKLLDIAKSENNQVKELLILTRIANDLHNENKFQDSRKMQSDVQRLLDDVCKDISHKNLGRENSWYLVLALHDVHFLNRDQKLGNSVKYLEYALGLLDQHPLDLGLRFRTQTYLLKMLENKNMDSGSLNRYFTLLTEIREAFKTTNDFDLLHAIKPIREAFIQISKYSIKKDHRDELVIPTGREIFEWLKINLGENHPEVVFTASELYSQFLYLGYNPEASQYFDFVVNRLVGIDEDSKITLHTKTRSYENMTKYLSVVKQLRNAEKFSREHIRLNKKLYGMSHQYVAQALRQFAFIMKDLGQRQEARKILTESLEMTKQCRPEFSGYIKMVEKELLRI